MHPISAVVNWISYINRSRILLENFINFKYYLKQQSKENSEFKNKSKCSKEKQIKNLDNNLLIIKKIRQYSYSIFIFILLIVLNYFINVVEAINLDTNNKLPIDSNKLNSNLNDNFNHNQLIRNQNHLTKQFQRTIRSIKLTNHRFKHRKSSLDKNYQTSKHLSNSKTNNWSILGDQEAEYALKLLESEHLTSAILHFIEITYKYAELNLPKLQNQNELLNQTFDNKKSTNKYYNSGSCVQVKLNSLRGLLNSKSFAKYSKQAETAKRTASLLTTLLSEHLEIPNDRLIKNHFTIHNDTSNIVLHKAFFWSLLKVNLQSDPNLFANGIIFRPDINKFPIKLSIQSNKDNDDNNQESNNSTNKPFSPYIFRNSKFINKFNQSNLNSTSNQTDQFNYINLSGLNSFQQRIVPNNNAIKFSTTASATSTTTTTADDIKDHMEVKAANLDQLKHTLSNKKQSHPFSNTYSYSSDWYLYYADKYLNFNEPFNYHKLTKSHYLNNSSDQGFWTVPYLDCSTTKTWLISYSVPFFGLSKSTNQIEFKGVVLISIDLSNEDINQCSEDDPFFPNSHKCDRETTECVPIKGLGFRRGSYACVCKSSYYIPNVTYSSASIKEKTIYNQTNSNNIFQPERHFFNGTAVESAFIETHIGVPKTPFAPLFPSHFQCIPCPKDCESCESNQSCKVSYTGLLRVCILGVQSFCSTIVIILSATTFRLRRSKSFASSRWIILESLLFGSLLLYMTVIIQYWQPTPLFCFLEKWFSELGFGFLYGSIMIKLYRIYAEFQTRKAHRVCVRDKDLLKYLCSIILVIIGYMSAWSALILETVNGFSNLTTQEAQIYIIQIGKTVDNLKFYLCKQLSWDFVTQLGELSFILAGIYLSYCIRNARSEFYREKWSLCMTIYLNFIVSGIYYILRYFLWNNLHPDLIYLMSFIRCQMTVTTNLVLIFGPKIFGQNRPPQLSSGSTRTKSRFFTGGNDQANRDRVQEAMKLHAILSNGEIDVSDINISEMDPDDIRSELRRVYTQLQILKNKTIRKDNPHISKRRGGRKTHRRFSLQAFNAHNKHVHKSSHHHHHQDHEQEITEVSRTPEESTASLEGPSQVYPELSNSK